MRKISPRAKQTIIVQFIQLYLKSNSLPAYHGQVSTEDVVEAVRERLAREGCRLTMGDQGLVYDLIREYGPVGEDDQRWLRVWSKSA